MLERFRKNTAAWLLTITMTMVVVCVALILLFPPEVKALPGAYVHNIYYSDASFTTVVGERYIYCNRSTYGSWGVTSQYVDHYEEECPN